MSMSARILLCCTLAIAAACPSSAEAGLLLRLRDSMRYTGCWISDHNGHHGRLKARVRREDCHTYRVRFCGTFFGVIPFVYSTPMTVIGRCANGDVMLCGQSRLPFFGEFTAHARMNASGFTANYRSQSDHGRFVMTRNR